MTQSRVLRVSDFYNPQPRQQLMHASPAYELLFGGAAGGGKSHGLFWEAIISCLETPGLTVAIFRRHFPELEATHIRKCLQLPKEFGRYIERRHTFEIPNGSMIEFHYCDNDNDVFNYQSFEWDLLIIDEVEQFTEFMYLYLSSRVRTTKAGVRTRIRLSANPGDVGHRFLKSRFVEVSQNDQIYLPDITTERKMLADLGLPTDIEARSRQFIQSKVSDNMALLKADPQYLLTLYQLPEDQRRMLLEGDWDWNPSQVFYNWRREKHLVAPFQLDSGSFQLWRGVDWGSYNPYAAVWMARHKDTGRVFLVQSHSQKGLTDEQQAKQILQKTPDGWANYTTLADPACWNKKQNAEVSIVQNWARAGLRDVHKARNDRINGLSFFRQLLEPIADGKPGFQVFDWPRNRAFLDTVPNLPYDKNGNEDVDTTADDHVYDATRYALTIARPHLDKGSVPVRRKKDAR